MGKASRMKKKRKEQGLAPINGGSGASHGNQAPLSSAQNRPRAKALFAELGGGNLIVIDGNGVAHGAEEARQMYWTDVNEGIRNRRSSCLPEMVTLGRLMNLSIFDVKISVVDHHTGRQNYEDIFSAMFLLGFVDCFQWLLEEAGRASCDWALLGWVFKGIVANAPHLEEETPHMAMAKMMVRFMAKAFHAKGWLEKGMADAGSTMGQPFARRIAQDYLEELAAQKERADLEAEITFEERSVEVGGLRI